VSLYWETLRSARWRLLKWRRVVFAGFACERCGAKYVGKRPKSALRFFELHHVTYARVGSEWLTDVRVLCPDCHAITHGLAA
jgi:predicted HNH restriction endonuclease